ncbi:hypothetical protein [Marivivens aquimaris]|uniref:hypothetical protein n=1 Tax=Marivivens aquimaris TaxID=2774876 RepID=UPI0018829FE4|nr:hypothetical protein [Marivivens aquimaris]
MMGVIVARIFGSRLGRSVTLLLGLVVAVLGYGAKEKLNGRREEQMRRRIRDLERMKGMQDAGKAVDRSRAGIDGRLRDGRF